MIEHDYAVYKRIESVFNSVCDYTSKIMSNIVLFAVLAQLCVSLSFGQNVNQNRYLYNFQPPPPYYMPPEMQQFPAQPTAITNQRINTFQAPVAAAPASSPTSIPMPAPTDLRGNPITYLTPVSSGTTSPGVTPVPSGTPDPAVTAAPTEPPTPCVTPAPNVTSTPPPSECEENEVCGPYKTWLRALEALEEKELRELCKQRSVLGQGSRNKCGCECRYCTRHNAGDISSLTESDESGCYQSDEDSEECCGRRHPKCSRNKNENKKHQCDDHKKENAHNNEQRCRQCCICYVSKCCDKEHRSNNTADHDNKPDSQEFSNELPDNENNNSDCDPQKENKNKCNKKDDEKDSDKCCDKICKKAKACHCDDDNNHSPRCSHRSDDNKPKKSQSCECCIPQRLCCKPKICD